MKDINNAVFSCTITEVEEINDYAGKEAKRMKAEARTWTKTQELINVLELRFQFPFTRKKLTLLLEIEF